MLKNIFERLLLRRQLVIYFTEHDNISVEILLPFNIENVNLYVI